ncbi:DNA-directed RNA polymerase subunit beta [Bacillus sp. FJAT-45350]|uniref:DNA-directed RNA polymerase subunit beta n=1 Tax=Bacillus sp. FJAT-45350 TaxID=2011014 RepID=UPI000BB8403F|nr:DNA-directed RNA polymerase subunit beta [Bacillus sp. FJAT-45350]
MSTEEKQSRLSKREEEREKQKEKKRSRGRKRERIRLIPIWVRLIIVAVLVFLSLIAGVMFGYGIVGDGTPTDALKAETWQHIFNILSGVEK